MKYTWYLPLYRLQSSGRRKTDKDRIVRHTTNSIINYKVIGISRGICETLRGKKAVDGRPEETIIIFLFFLPST